jgi:hypothetical protein
LAEPEREIVNARDLSITQWLRLVLLGSASAPRSDENYVIASRHRKALNTVNSLVPTALFVLFISQTIPLTYPSAAIALTLWFAVNVIVLIKIPLERQGSR